jgi:hypothetical protein
LCSPFTVYTLSVISNQYHWMCNKNKQHQIFTSAFTTCYGWVWPSSGNMCDMDKLWLTVYKFMGFQLNCDTRFSWKPINSIINPLDMPQHIWWMWWVEWSVTKDWYIQVFDLHSRQKTDNHINDSTRL